MKRALVFSVAFLAAYALANTVLGTSLVNWTQSLAALAIAVGGTTAVALAARRFKKARWGASNDIAAPDAAPAFGKAEIAAFSAALALATLAGYVQHGEYFFIHWAFRSGASSFRHSWLFRFALAVPFAAIPFLLCRKPRKWPAMLPAVLLAVAEAAAAWALFAHTRWAAPYSDDHPSFLFRIAEFWGSFPWLENYVPQWNAGVVNSVLTSSGVPGYALFTAPLQFIFGKPHLYHAAGMAIFHAFFAPWLTVWGFRACGKDWKTALLGGLLVLYSNRLFFSWALHFGTVGAAASWAMAPSAFLFAYAIAEKGRTDFRTIAGLAISGAFLCAWPQMWLFAAALALAVATSLGRWLEPGGWRRPLALLAAGAVVALLLAHPLLAVLKAKDLIGYTTEKVPGAAGAALFPAAWEIFKKVFSKCLMMQSNPLVAVFGLVGILTLRQGALRRWLLIVALACAAIFSAGNAHYPNMQLYRMAIPLALLLAVPAAVRIGEILDSKMAFAAPLKGAVALLLLLGAANTARIYNGQGFAPYEPLDPAISEMAEWIAGNVPDQSRVAFAGPAVHAYGHGHVAYLPVLTGREMMSCDYYGFPPGTYEPDFPPRSARKRKGGITAYFREHGVSHVVTCRRNYIELFEAHPGEYEQVARFPYHHTTGDVDIRIFAIKGGGKGLLRGTGGRVEATFNRIEVAFEGEPPETAVLAYHWNDRLRADPPAQIAPVPTATPGEDPFIEVRPNGAAKVVVRYRNRL